MIRVMPYSVFNMVATQNWILGINKLKVRYCSLNSDRFYLARKTTEIVMSQSGSSYMVIN